MSEERWPYVRRGEWPLVLVSTAYFALLIGGYMMMRPIRETLAIRSDDTQVLFLVVFCVMFVLAPLFGWLVSNVSKKVFLPVSYVFFIVNLAGFGFWLQVEPDSLWAGRCFFVWLSVFNMFVVSVFWSLMVDLFNGEQARRLFGLIAAGGSLGGVIGPLASALLVDVVGIGGLVYLACGVLMLTLVCQFFLVPRVSHRAGAGGERIGGSLWAGLTALKKNRYLAGIALLLVFLPITNTFAYFLQQELVASTFANEADRVRWFSAVDSATQIIGSLLQLGITGWILNRFGAAIALVAIPLFAVIGFAVLAIAPGVIALAVFQAIRRGGEYGLTKPARELLYTRVTEEEKYKSKNFIDTAVYRGGDSASGFAYRGLADAIGSGLSAMAAIAVIPAALWCAVSVRMGRTFERNQS